MLNEFKHTSVTYVPGPLLPGEAAEQVISKEDFATARREIIEWPGYAPTPLVELNNLAIMLSVGSVLYKHEGGRFGLGSFKSLGGSYAAFRVLLREISKTVGHDVPLAEVGEEKFAAIAAQTTVISATDGNHGRSVAWGAQRLGMPCRIYIHSDVSGERAQAMRDLGAVVIRVDGNYDETVQVTREEASANDWFIVSDTSWPSYTEVPREVMAGYGVMVHEINQVLQVAPTHVFLQGGVGGLAAAVIASLRQYWGVDSPRAVVVEPELAPCLMASAKAKKATAFPISKETIMAGLSCGEPSKIAWEVLAEEVTDFITIPDSVVAPAVRLMARPIEGDTPLEVGETAVAGLAGLICAATQSDLRSKIGLDQNSRILLIGSEGVTDRSLFNKVMEDAE